MNEPIEKCLPAHYNGDWYLGLSRDMKLKVFKEALEKFPYLADHMKINNIKASDENFVNHYTFNMMIEILRGK